MNQPGSQFRVARMAGQLGLVKTGGPRIIGGQQCLVCFAGRVMFHHAATGPEQTLHWEAQHGNQERSPQSIPQNGPLKSKYS
jgi:hypothetical protein